MLEAVGKGGVEKPWPIPIQNMELRSSRALGGPTAAVSHVASEAQEMFCSVLCEDDQQQLCRALDVVHEAIESLTLGGYLFGSAALSGLRPPSDLDLFVVNKGATKSADKKHLARELMAISGKPTSDGMWRRVELTIVVQEEVKPWRYPPRIDFQYGDWLRSQFLAGNLDPSPVLRPDLALLITMVLAANTPLFGPSPAEVLDPVPYEDQVRAMLSDIPRLQEAANSDTTNVVLTLARVATTLATGDIRSKDGAADWLLERLPESRRPILAQARDIYLGEEPDDWELQEQQVGSFIDFVVALIDRYKGGLPLSGSSI